MDTPTTQNLEVSKDFAVPVERLYAAWTAPDELKQWWHPMGASLQQVNADIKVGGRVEYVFSNSQQPQSFTISGEYKEVEEGRRLVYTWNWEVPEPALENSPFVLHITFSSTGSGSRLQVKQEAFSSEEAVQPHREGWEKALNDLQHYLQA